MLLYVKMYIMKISIKYCYTEKHFFYILFHFKYGSAKPSEEFSLIRRQPRVRQVLVVNLQPLLIHIAAFFITLSTIWACRGPPFINVACCKTTTLHIESITSKFTLWISSLPVSLLQARLNILYPNYWRFMSTMAYVMGNWGSTC